LKVGEDSVFLMVSSRVFSIAPASIIAALILSACLMSFALNSNYNLFLSFRGLVAADIALPLLS
jgi:hypothetical protein